MSRLAAIGPMSEVESLLNEGSPVDPKDSNGRTPLSRAAEYGRFGIAKFLIQHGAIIDIRDIVGRTPLSFAAEFDREALVELLLDKGANINSQCVDGRTPLHYAALAGNPGIVKMLLDRGADRTIRGCEGGSALAVAEMAAEKHRDEVVELLKVEFFEDGSPWRIYPRVTDLEYKVFNRDWKLKKEWDWLFKAGKGPIEGHLFFKSWDEAYTAEDLMRGRGEDLGPWAIKFP